MDYLDDDENVKAMRDTDREIGLTALLVRALSSTDQEQVTVLLSKSLELLGVKQCAPTVPDMEKSS
jgi:hypothetical protein